MPILFVVLGFVCMVGAVLVLDDGLDFFIDIFEGIFDDTRFIVKRAVNIARRAALTALYTAIGLLVLYALVFIGWVGALMMESTKAVVVLSIALSLIAAIFFIVINWLTVVTKRPGPSVLATLTLIPLPIALWAALFPFHFYEWFLAAYGVFLLVGFAFIILGRLIRSTVFLGPYAITAILTLSAILAFLVFAFPEQARAMVIDHKISNRDSGRESLEKEITLRPIDKFKSEDKAYWWHHSKDSAGRDVKSRYMGANGKQCYSVKDETFKTVLAPADSVEMGGTYVQAYFPDQETGEYIFLDVQPNETITMGGDKSPCTIVVQKGQSLEDILPWVDASKVEFAKAIVQKPEEVKKPEGEVVTKQTIKTADDISVYACKRAKHTGINVKAGDVVYLNSSGSVRWDPVLPAVGPTGTSYSCSTLQSPNDFPLPSTGCGALVLEVSGDKYSGSGPLIIKNGGEILLDINDRYQARPDNSGEFRVHLEVKR
jgi:hypothetical protein